MGAGLSTGKGKKDMATSTSDVESVASGIVENVAAGDSGKGVLSRGGSSISGNVVLPDAILLPKRQAFVTPEFNYGFPPRGRGISADVVASKGGSTGAVTSVQPGRKVASTHQSATHTEHGDALSAFVGGAGVVSRKTEERRDSSKVAVVSAKPSPLLGADSYGFPKRRGATNVFASVGSSVVKR